LIKISSSKKGNLHPRHNNEVHWQPVRLVISRSNNNPSTEQYWKTAL